MMRLPGISMQLIEETVVDYIMLCDVVLCDVPVV